MTSKTFKIFTFSLLLIFSPTNSSFAIEDSATVPKKTEIIERLNEKISWDLVFTDQKGTKAPLREFFLEGRPLILAPVYYECPMLCNLTQQGMVDVLNSLKLIAGKDFKVISLSFNHKETVEIASNKAKAYRALLKEPHLPQKAWDFLIGSEENIKKLTKEIGFSFEKDQADYIHQAMFAVITPDARISRYFYGIQFAPDALRFALVEASQGRIGSSLDKVLMYCFRFDPSKGKYTLAIWNITRAIALLIAFSLAGVLVFFRVREKRQNEAI